MSRWLGLALATGSFLFAEPLPAATPLAWGRGDYGQLGDGNFYTTTPQLGTATVVQVSALTTVTAIAGGGLHSLALNSDGTVWAWGDGQLGQLALDSNSMVKAWGAGGYGQLADNSYPAGLVTPVSPNFGQSVRAIAAGSSHSLALPSTTPTVTIDQPLEGASFAAPADVTIEATVIDIDGVVTQVDFVNFDFGCQRYTLLGTVAAPPYRFTLTNLLSGNYSIFVCAQPGFFCASVQISVVGPIQTLVNAAAPGSTVDIPAGVYLETVVINKNLTLRGAGARSTAIDGSNGCQTTLVVTGGATVTLSGLTVTRGGILNSGTLTVNDCAITGNNTLSGIENTISGAVFLNNCTVSGNAYHGVANAGTMILNGCTISGNFCCSDPYEPGGDGGGLSNHGTLSLNNCTVTGNIAGLSRGGSGGLGGGIANSASGTVSCKSTIIANNLGGAFQGGMRAAPDFSGDLNSQGYNLIGNTAGMVILGITTGNLLNIDPLLGPLQNNGGPTDTQALLPGSPALDAGISGGPNTDQRGFPRPIDRPSIPNASDGTDIGAFEYGAILLEAESGTLTSPMTVAADPLAFGGQYVFSLVNGGGIL